MGWFSSLDHFLSTFRLYWVPFFMIARVLSAAAGTATVAAVYVIGTRLFDRLTAGLAAFFLALAFLHVRDSHFGVTETDAPLLGPSRGTELCRGPAAEAGGRHTGLAGDSRDRVPEYSYCPPEVKSLATERYSAVRIFKAMDLDRNLFDRQDAFYYPYAGFHGVQRGGPNYVVYTRKPENQN